MDRVLSFLLASAPPATPPQGANGEGAEAAAAEQPEVVEALGSIEKAVEQGDFDQVWVLLTDFVVTYGMRVLGAIAFLLLALLVARLVGRFTRRSLERAHVEITLAQFLGKVARIVVIVLGLVSCLGIFGVPMTSFAAVIGAAGLAIGLALQGSLSNVASGIALALFRPFRVGDVVVLQGYTGTVKEIDLFTTRVDTFENRRIILPNGKIFGDVIENITFNPVRRVEVSVGVDYSADIDKTRQVLAAAAKGVPDIVDEPAPMIVLNGLGASSVDWVVRVWCENANFLKVKDAATEAVKKSLDKAGIGIPFPQRVVTILREREAG